MRLTHREACYELQRNARRFTVDEITRETWYAEVDAILTARFDGEPALGRSLAADHGRTPSASRTSTRPGGPPSVEGRSRERATALEALRGGR